MSEAFSRWKAVNNDYATPLRKLAMKAKRNRIAVKLPGGAVIQRYPTRRLGFKGKYINRSHLIDLIVRGEKFTILDHKHQTDLTKDILIRIFQMLQTEKLKTIPLEDLFQRIKTEV